MEIWRGIWESGLEMKEKVGSVWGREEIRRELGVGGGWGGEGIKRIKLGMGHEGEMMRGSQLGRRDKGNQGSNQKV